MISIFTTLKPMTAEFAVIQERSILNWKEKFIGSQIVVYGNEKGVDKLAKKYSLTLIKKIRRNKQGTPIVSDMFSLIRAFAKYKLLMYTNADIIFLGNPRETLQNISLKKFLISGARWDFDIPSKNAQDFSELVKIKHKLKIDNIHSTIGADYFVFPKSVSFNIPSFAVGRTVWDNWLLYQAKLNKIPLVDGTFLFKAVHQNHGFLHPGGEEYIWKGKEHQVNLALAKEQKKVIDFRASDWLLTPEGLRKPPISISRVWKKLQILPAINPQKYNWLNPVIRAIEASLNLSGKIIN